MLREKKCSSNNFQLLFQRLASKVRPVMAPSVSRCYNNIRVFTGGV